MGLQEVLQTVFGAANAAAHEKAVQLIQGLTFPGIITDQIGGMSMERLTIPDKRVEGGWQRPVIDVRTVKEEAMTLYWQLKQYEDTGLTPDQLIEIDKLYAELSREVQQYREIGTVEECREARKRVLLINH